MKVAIAYYSQHHVAVRCRIRKLLMTAALLAGVVFLTGCNSNRAGSFELTVTKRFWSAGVEQSEMDVTKYVTPYEEDGKQESEQRELSPGQIIYEGFGSSITIKSFDGDRITLQIEESCFVEPNADGTVNLMAKPIGTLVIRHNETKAITTQTMDGGLTLTFEYKRHR